MPNRLQNVDPGWAWSTFEPDTESLWSRRAAAHLFRRAGYAASSGELDAAVKRKPADVVRDLLSAHSTTGGFEAEMTQLGKATLSTGNSRKLAAWWLHRAMRTPDPLGDKMTLFWHGHFATSADKVEDATLMYHQHLMLRRHALGTFESLVQTISHNPAMLVYLDSATNRKRHPNENYARELMELFCLGLDQYTEADIREIARCFTGWEIRRGRFNFNKYQHDKGTKSLLGETGNFGGEDAVRIVVAQPACAEFIARKLIRFFVVDDVEIPGSLVQPLAEDFREHDLSIARLVQRILTSQLFFSEHSVGRKIRSPVELAVGLLRALEGTTNTIRLAGDLEALGQGLFYPPSVKGWDGGRAWINSSTLLGRANLVGRLVNSEQAHFAGGSLADLVEQHQPGSDEQTVDWLLELLVAVPVTDAVRDQLIQVAETTPGDRSRRLAEVIYRIGTLPEFQLA